MTQVLKFYDGTTTVNILDGDYSLRPGGWSYKTSDGPIWERFEIVSNKVAATVRARQLEIDAFADQVSKYKNDTLRPTPVWLYWQSEGESAKRALIHKIETEIVGQDVLLPLLRKNAQFLRVAVLHGPWENESETTVATISNLSILGGTGAPANAAGTMDQRISSLVLSGSDVTVMQKAWIGFRPLYNGTAGFDSLWLGSDFNANTDATPSGNNMVIDFATETGLFQRMNADLDDIVASNFDDFVGRYRVLMRLTVDAGTTEVYAELRFGWSSYANMEVAGSQFLTGADMYPNSHLVDMGEIVIPPTGYRTGGPVEADLADFQVQLWMERLSVAGTITVNSIILIPSEHLIFVDCGNTGAIGNTGSLKIYTTPADEVYAIDDMSVSGWQTCHFEPHDWAYPKEGGLVVIAAQTATASPTGVVLNLDMTLVPRWRSFRS